MPFSGVSEGVSPAKPPSSNIVDWHRKIFISLIVASLVIWYQPIVSTIKLALHNDAYTHILLILPISIALIFSERKALHSLSWSFGWLGWFLISGGVLLRDLGVLLKADSGLPLTMLGLVLWWIGAVISCFGVRALRAFLFPLCFLFLSAPLPEQSVEKIKDILQHQSAFATAILFHAAGVPVARDGVAVSIPGLDIEVAKECSSIRSSTMLIVITLVLAYLFLGSWWRRLLLVGMSLLLSVAKNAVRIFTIAELGTQVDPGYLHGRLHHQGGVVFLGLAIVVDLFFLWVLRGSEFRASASSNSC